MSVTQSYEADFLSFRVDPQQSLPMERNDYYFHKFTTTLEETSNSYNDSLYEYDLYEVELPHFRVDPQLSLPIKLDHCSFQKFNTTSETVIDGLDSSVPQRIPLPRYKCTVLLENGERATGKESMGKLDQPGPVFAIARLACVDATRKEKWICHCGCGRSSSRGSPRLLQAWFHF